jgi:DNA-binding transcriptional MerR regulator
VSALISIGDFSRASHLSIRTLRHYHEIGLLAPAETDPNSGYRYYEPDQIQQAQVIRRLRGLQMPLAEITAVLAAPTTAERNVLIAKHLDRVEIELRETASAASELRALIERPGADGTVEHRTVPPMPAIAIQEMINLGEALVWYQGALAELHAIANAQQLRPSGPPGGMFDGSLWEDERGTATLFLPTDTPAMPIGRVAPVHIPAAELAVITHSGPLQGVDRAYATLALHVTHHEIGVAGPLREFYPVSLLDTKNPEELITEVGWPIFRSDEAD